MAKVQPPIEWGWQKTALVFCAALAGAISTADPLPFSWGVGAKAIAGVLAAALAATFAYLLKPPTQQKPEPEGEEK
jgi:hypothetical protein